ncbi:MAG: Protein phosphatase, partial [Rickettsiales bacterium]|nr:Protein phosphatase [Rickettsiales bacterium]
MSKYRVIAGSVNPALQGVIDELNANEDQYARVMAGEIELIFGPQYNAKLLDKKAYKERNQKVSNPSADASVSSSALLSPSAISSSSTPLTPPKPIAVPAVSLSSSSGGKAPIVLKKGSPVMSKNSLPANFSKATQLPFSTKLTKQDRPAFDAWWKDVISYYNDVYQNSDWYKAAQLGDKNSGNLSGCVIKNSTSDHAEKSAHFRCGNTELYGSSWNMMNKGHVGKAYPNTPLFVNENTASYEARKMVQIDKIFKKIDNWKHGTKPLDFDFLQECDFLFVNQKFDSRDGVAEAKSRCQFALQKGLEARGWSYLTTYALNHGKPSPVVRDMAMLYNAETLVYQGVAHDQAILPVKNVGTGFAALFRTQAGQAVRLVSLHLDYGHNYGQEVRNTFQEYTDEGVLAIGGGDTNHPANTEIDGLITTWGEVSNISAAGGSARDGITDEDKRPGKEPKKKSYDGFFASPSSRNETVEIQQSHRDHFVKIPGGFELQHIAYDPKQHVHKSLPGQAWIRGGTKAVAAVPKPTPSSSSPNPIAKPSTPLAPPSRGAVASPGTPYNPPKQIKVTMVPPAQKPVAAPTPSAPSLGVKPTVFSSSSSGVKAPAMSASKPATPSLKTFDAWTDDNIVRAVSKLERKISVNGLPLVPTGMEFQIWDKPTAELNEVNSLVFGGLQKPKTDQGYIMVVPLRLSQGADQAGHFVVAAMSVDKNHSISKITVFNSIDYRKHQDVPATEAERIKTQLLPALQNAGFTTKGTKVEFDQCYLQGADLGCGPSSFAGFYDRVIGGETATNRRLTEAEEKAVRATLLEAIKPSGKLELERLVPSSLSANPPAKPKAVSSAAPASPLRQTKVTHVPPVQLAPKVASPAVAPKPAPSSSAAASEAKALAIGTASEIGGRTYQEDRFVTHDSIAMTATEAEKFLKGSIATLVEKTKEHQSGTTFTTAALTNDGHIVTAHLGDSPAVLFVRDPQTGKVEVVRITVDHDTALYNARNSLAVNRALGDKAFEGTISREPEIGVHALSKYAGKEVFLMVCSDGAFNEKFECLHFERYAELLEQEFKKGKPTIEELTKKIIAKALEGQKGSKDVEDRRLEDARAKGMWVNKAYVSDNVTITLAKIEPGKTGILSVMDGHGGAETSELVSKEFKGMVKEKARDKAKSIAPKPAVPATPPKEKDSKGKEKAAATPLLPRSAISKPGGRSPFAATNTPLMQPSTPESLAEKKDKLTKEIKKEQSVTEEIDEIVLKIIKACYRDFSAETFGRGLATLHSNQITDLVKLACKNRTDYLDKKYRDNAAKELLEDLDNINKVYLQLVAFIPDVQRSLVSAEVLQRVVNVLEMQEKKASVLSSSNPPITVTPGAPKPSAGTPATELPTLPKEKDSKGKGKEKERDKAAASAAPVPVTPTPSVLFNGAPIPVSSFIIPRKQSDPAPAPVAASKPAAPAPAPVASKPATPAPAPVASKPATPAPAPVAPKPAALAPAPVAPKPAAPAPAPLAPKPAALAPAPLAPKPAALAPAPLAPKPATPAPAPLAPKPATPAPAPVAAPKPAAPAPAPSVSSSSSSVPKISPIAPKPVSSTSVPVPSLSIPAPAGSFVGRVSPRRELAGLRDDALASIGKLPKPISL